MTSSSCEVSKLHVIVEYLLFIPGFNCKKKNYKTRPRDIVENEVAPFSNTVYILCVSIESQKWSRDLL